MEKIVYERKAGNNEYTALRKDGSTFSVLIYTNVILKNNTPIGFRGAIIDISDRKEAESNLINAKEEAEKNQQLFMAVIEQSPLSIQIFDKTGLAINANNAWSELW